MIKVEIGNGVVVFRNPKLNELLEFQEEYLGLMIKAFESDDKESMQSQLAKTKLNKLDINFFVGKVLTVDNVVYEGEPITKEQIQSLEVSASFLSELRKKYDSENNAEVTGGVAEKKQD